MNILQALGLQSPGIVADDYGDMPAYPAYPAGDVPGANSGYAPPAAVAAPDTGVPGFGDFSSAPAVPQQGAPNMLQSLVAPPAQPVPAAAPVDAPTRPARARSSFIDTVGRVSDVLAKVGGAPALYQPTLDARQDRSIALTDHDRQVDLEKLKLALSRQEIATGQGALTDAQSKRTQQAMKYLNAIRDSNPNADVSKIWPILAQQVGLSSEDAGSLGQQIVANPEIIKGIAEGTDKEKYSGSVVLGRNKEGKLVAYQPNLTSGEARSILPDGVEALDPVTAVNLGGSTALVGKYSNAAPKIILPNSEKPGQAADRQQRGQIASDRNTTAITIAGMPARAKATDKGAGDVSGVLTLLDNIQGGFGDLHKMKSLPGDNGGAVGNVLSALGRTHLGQSLGEQAGSPSAQKRLEIMKNVSALQQAMLKALPASATRTRFEQEMLARGLPDPSKMSYDTARTVIGQLRDSFQRALRESQGARPILRAPIRPNVKPTSSNW